MKPETKLLLRWGGFIAFLVVLIVMSWNVVSSNASRYRTTAEFRNMALTNITIPYGETETMHFEARVADDEAEQAAGFANIGAEIIKQSVILVVYNRDVQVKFSTENVEAPLDLMFIDVEGTILKVYQAEAHSTETFPPENESFSFRYVLEAPVGYFDAINASSTRVVVSLEAFLQQQVDQEL